MQSISETWIKCSSPNLAEGWLFSLPRILSCLHQLSVCQRTQTTLKERKLSNTPSGKFIWFSTNEEISNELVARNRILVFAAKVLGSPRGKHCNSLEKNACIYKEALVFVWTTMIYVVKSTNFSPCAIVIVKLTTCNDLGLLIYFIIYFTVILKKNLTLPSYKHHLHPLMIKVR